MNIWPTMPNNINQVSGTQSPVALTNDGHSLHEEFTAGAGGQGNENEAPVVACESFLPMFKVARRVLAANRANRHIRMINCRSDDLSVAGQPGA